MGLYKTQHSLKGFTMFSKFDTNIQSEELVSHEPTQADWDEYQAWLEEQEAEEPLSTFDPHLDFYRDMEEAYDDYDEYEEYDERDLYGAEWENYAVREWD